MSKKRLGRALSAIHIRDIEKKLFSYLFVNKAATSLQIARDIYRGMSHQALYKRLNRLIHFRYIEANYQKELGGRLVYSLGAKAFTEYLQGSRDHKIRQQLKSDSILHDLDLVDIRHRVKKLESVAHYYSENVLRSGIELQSEDSLRPFKNFFFDAVLEIKKHNGRHFLALEYERNLKFSSRYLSYFKRLYANSEIGAVLFVCGNSKLMSQIQQKERSVCANGWPKVFYTTLANVLTEATILTFENLNQEKINLK